MSDIRLPIRQLVEFLLRSGSIDSRFAGFDRALEGARIHRRLQKAAGEGYAAEVPLCADYTVDGIRFTLEGRADGIFTNETGVVTIDEIKTTAVPEEEICEDMNPCHWAQGMVYGAIYSAQENLSAVDVRLTYYQIDTDRILRFVRHFSRQELEQFLHKLLHRYLPWAQRQLAWQETRSGSLTAMRFPFEAYRPGQRALAGEVWRACTAAPSKKGTRLFCQAPTGIGKTMSALFPALKAMGSGCGEKLFYLTARNTTQAAAEDAIARLRAVQPDLALRSVTLTAKEKACLHPDAEGHPACLPEVCPYANGYYDRIKNALAALLDGSGQFSRAALADTARQFTVCPFELGLDLSEWCDVVIGDYNYLFDPVVHLKRFFDTSGDWLFLIDEAHNLPARAAFLARFEPDPAHTLLGFAVMGGIFGEGVDLAGDRLIGCAIVGVGLPQVNPRQEMLRRYYDAQNGAGFDYAYRYPGMNKVLQAAGRVIRTPEDKGVVLLLDDRFAKPEYQRLFPPHWRHLQYLQSSAALEAALADFWSSKPE